MKISSKDLEKMSTEDMEKYIKKLKKEKAQKKRDRRRAILKKNQEDRDEQEAERLRNRATLGQSTVTVAVWTDSAVNMYMPCTNQDVTVRHKDEIKAIKSSFSEFFKNKFIFKEVNPIRALQESFDVYVVDYGGLSDGWDSNVAVDNVNKSMIKLIEERPNTLFIVNTHFTYDSLAHYHYTEFKKDFPQFPNLVAHPGYFYKEDGKVPFWFTKVKEWFGVEK